MNKTLKILAFLIGGIVFAGMVYGASMTITVSPVTCGGTDKVSSINSDGSVTCSADEQGSGEFTTTTINGLSATAYTFATSGAPGLFIDASGSTLTWRVATSSATASGFLSSGDWTTFNGKQNSLGSNYVSSTAAGVGISVDATTGAITITNSRPFTTSTFNGFTGLTWTATGTASQIAADVSGNATTFRLQMAGGTCSGTNKISSISATGTVVCTADETGGGGSFFSSSTVLSDAVVSGSGTDFKNVFSYTGGASKNVFLEGYIMATTSATTVGIQLRPQSDDAGNVGWCMFASMSAATTWAPDYIAIGSNPADTGETAELTNVGPHVRRVYCAWQTDASPGAVNIQIVAETTGSVSALKGSYMTIMER
jgi:hypothetical protein